MKVEWSHLFLNVSLKVERWSLLMDWVMGWGRKREVKDDPKALRHSWCPLGTPLKTTALECRKVDKLKGKPDSVPLLPKTLRRLPIVLLIRLLTWLTEALHDHTPSYFFCILSHLPPPYILSPIQSPPSMSLTSSSPVFCPLGSHARVVLSASLHHYYAQGAAWIFFIFSLVAHLFSFMFLHCVFLITACIYSIIVFPVLYSLWSFNHLSFLLEWKLQRVEDHVCLSQLVSPSRA